MQISQTEENLAKTINCVAQSNLSFTEGDLKLLVTELSRSLMDQSRVVITTTIKQCIYIYICMYIYIGLHFLWFQVTNSSQSNLRALFAELPAESFTSGNLNDAEFMSFWFQIKMKPLLPQIPQEFLSCINTRAFSCQAYRALYVNHVPFNWHMIAVHYLIITNPLVCPW